MSIILIVSVTSYLIYEGTFMLTGEIKTLNTEFLYSNPNNNSFDISSTNFTFAIGFENVNLPEEIGNFDISYKTNNEITSTSTLESCSS